MSHLSGKPTILMPWYRDWFLYGVFILVIWIDQITKFLVRTNLSLGEAYPSSGTFRIVHTFNTGSAFGLFEDQTFPLILASLLGIGVIVALYRHYSFPSSLLRLSLGLQLGGATGNLADRLRMGHVTDFIDLGPWWIFNLADASIVSGIILLAFIITQTDKNPRQPAALASVDGVALDTRLDMSCLSTCPLCHSNMFDLPRGRRCSGCGAQEWVESAGGTSMGPFHGQT